MRSEEDDMSLVTISHQLGTGGAEIGQRLAARLDYRYVGSEDLAKVATRYGLAPERATHLGEAKPSLVERLSASTRLYLAVIQAALYEFAEEDQAVLLGRGGQWLLRGVPHALRVRIIAPFDVRRERVARRLAESGQPASPDAVRQMVSRDDTDKAGRARYLYGSDLDDPTLYDLIVSTSHLPEDPLVDALEGLVRRPELRTTPESARLVRDRSLVARVQAALGAADETRRHRFEVEARDGAVTLTGNGGLEEAAKVAGQVRGARRVETRWIEVPLVPPVVM
jgi:cytidylate kinase